MADGAGRAGRDAIVMVCGSMPPDRCGVGAYTARLVSAMTAHRDVWCVQPTGTEHVEGTEVVEVDTWNVRSLVRLLHICRAVRPAWVIVQYPTARYRRSIAVLLFVPALRLAGRRVLVVLHEHAASPRIGKLANLVMVALSTRVFVSNGLDRRALPARFRRRTDIVPIGSNIPVVASRVGPAAPDQWLTPDEPRPRVGFFGHPFRSKRIEVFIDMVNDDAWSYEFEVISMFDHQDGYQEEIFERLEDIARQRPNRLRVIDGASDGEVSRRLCVIDYLMVPEQHPLTGKSGAALAGIAHGVVVIGRLAMNPDDNLPYIDGVNCVLLATMDGAAVAAAIARLESDPSSRERILLGAQTLAAASSWEGIARRYEELIDI